MKLLEKGNDLTLDELRIIATTLEMTEFKMKAMDCGKPEEQVNRISGTKPKTWKSQSKSGGKDKKIDMSGPCYRCGKTGHFGKDPDCPAINKKVS